LRTAEVWVEVRVCNVMIPEVMMAEVMATDVTTDVTATELSKIWAKGGGGPKTNLGASAWGREPLEPRSLESKSIGLQANGALGL
jgi:hypothetical protein